MDELYAQMEFAKKLVVCCSILLLSSLTHAGRPVWSLTPLTTTKLSLTRSQTAIVEYRVTNNSHRVHTLGMINIPGVTQITAGAGVCSRLFTLRMRQSCILRLRVAGNLIPAAIKGGPIVCQNNNRLYCYQPGLQARLNIVAIPTPSVQYTITPTAGPNGSISPSTTQKVSRGGTIIFSATANVGYGVYQWLVDGNVVQAGGSTYQLTNITANHTVHVTFGAATLSPSVSSLSLSVNCQPSSSCTTTQDAALTGNPRQVTIQNTGSIAATNVTVSPQALPPGTSITSNTCTGTLDAGSSCTFVLTPGAVASPDGNNMACTSGTQPVSSTVTVGADGGLSTQITALVLGYGCQYQGGFIYAVDDTTPNTGSIGGKVMSLVDQAAPRIGLGPQATSVIWSSNGSGPDSANVSNDTLPGIDETSTSSAGSPSYAAFAAFFASTYTNPNPFTAASFSNCEGVADGQCNVANIFTFYNQFITNYNEAGVPPFTAFAGPTNSAYYAAGKCQGTINGYSDWYLPAICEMDAVNNSVVCPANFQSMINSLSFLVGLFNAPTPSTSCSPPAGTDCLAGTYWTSTVSAIFPQDRALGEFFSLGSSSQTGTFKNRENGVRCSRILTI